MLSTSKIMKNVKIHIADTVKNYREINLKSFFSFSNFTLHIFASNAEQKIFNRNIKGMS